MRRNDMLKKLIAPGLVLGALGLTSGPAAAVVDVYLIAKETTVGVPDGSGGTISVPMWGFALDGPGPNGDGTCYNTTPIAARRTCTAGAVAAVPGPRLNAGTDPQVRIYLTNMLPTVANGGEPVSIVIPGQEMPWSNANNGPTWIDNSVGPNAGGGPGVRRVRSFGREAAPNGGRRAFIWNNFRNTTFAQGSYIYHSGTHPQVQVQMGLYGAITRDSAAGEAYPGVPYDSDVVLFYSEIDPVLHADVAAGTYGTTGLTSTLGYQPRYYLVNGEAFTTATAAIPVVAGERTLLRMFNMGLENHTPVLQNLRMSIVAEDGNPYPYAREQYSAILAAGKTKDAIVIATAAGTYAVYDGMLGLGNGASTTGGMLRFLQVGGGANLPPTADPQPGLTTGVNVALPITLTGSDPDSDPLTFNVVTGPTNGALTGTAPNLSYLSAVSGTDSFTFTVNDGTVDSAPATVAIQVVSNNPPVAGPQGAESTAEDSAVTIALNGSDGDGDPMTFTVTAGPSNGSLNVTSGALPGSVTYTPNADYDGADSFDFTANDGTATSAAVTVNITMTPVNDPPVAFEDTAGTTQGVGVTFSVTMNDVDVDDGVDPSTVVILRNPRRGTAVNNGDGTITYTPNNNFTGTDVLRYRVRDFAGVLSQDPNGRNRTRVRINVTP